MAFSGAVRITDINDYIAPSQACVVSLNGNKLDVKEDHNQPPEVQLHKDRAAAPPLPSLTLPLGPAAATNKPPEVGDSVKVTLHDCLACSGCITSAETVLLQHQSGEEFLSKLQDPATTVVVSISPQSRSALAALYQMPPADAFQRLVAWFRSIGVHAVFDLGTARDLALLETAAEFIQRYRSSQQAAAGSNSGTRQPTLPLHPPATSEGGPLAAFTRHVQHAQQAQHTQQDGLTAAHPPTQQHQQDSSGMDIDEVPNTHAHDGCWGNGSCGDGAVQGNGVAWGHAHSAHGSGPPWSSVNRVHANGHAGVQGASNLGQPQVGPQGPLHPDPSRAADLDNSAHDAGPLPMLASACPGWVCYAEKAHGDLVLPHIASAKSPQAVMGSLVKRLMPQQLGAIHPSSIYHCTVMPCYDKKLEASRDELSVPDAPKVPEVDNCLTTGELHKLLEQHGVSHLSQVPKAAPPSSLLMLLPQEQRHLHGHLQEDGRLYGLPGGSGGYMDFVIRTAAMELFGRSFPTGPLPLKTLRNSDFQEVVLEDEAGKVLLRCAVANGFRNIQTIVRKMKMRRCEYHYVEVMACPSGCLAGGGQLKPSPNQTPQQMLEQLELMYHHQDIIPRHPADNPAVQHVYCNHVPGGPGSGAARSLLHTSYCKRESTVATTATVSDW